MTPRSIDRSRRAFVAAGVAGCAFAFAPRDARAEAWPARPVRVVLGYAPGGAADIVARELSAPLTKLLGQPIVVDYKPGASGIVAAGELAHAAPDGYTLGLLDNAPLTIVPALRSVGYDPVKSFTPIVMVTQLPQVLVANPKLPASRTRELIELMKKAPGQLNFASGGNGSVGHLAAELLKARSGTFAVHVPYKGGAPAITALVAGEVQFAFLTYAATAPFIKAGQLKALGVSSKARLPQLPSVPTVAEDGLPGYEAPGWFVLMGPAGLPTPIVDVMAKATAQTLAQPAVVTRFDTLGQTVASAIDPRKTIAAELVTWRQLIAERKIVIEG